MVLMSNICTYILIYFQIFLFIVPSKASHSILLEECFLRKKAKHRLSILEKFIKVANYVVLNSAFVWRWLSGNHGRKKERNQFDNIETETQPTQKSNTHLCDLISLLRISKAGN